MYDPDDPIYQADYQPSRDPIDRITDEMLTKPFRKLSHAERAIIRRALDGPRRPDLLARWAKLQGHELEDDSKPDYTMISKDVL